MAPSDLSTKSPANESTELSMLPEISFLIQISIYAQIQRIFIWKKSYFEFDLFLDETVQNKLTGWIQWTFTKCCFSVYTSNSVGQIKLCIEAEDSIVSLEFDEVFHKLKVKTASFGIYHRER